MRMRNPPWATAWRIWSLMAWGIFLKAPHTTRKWPFAPTRAWWAWVAMPEVLESSPRRSSSALTMKKGAPARVATTCPADTWSPSVSSESKLTLVLAASSLARAMPLSTPAFSAVIRARNKRY